MDYQFEILQQTRKNTLALLNGLTLEALNTIPNGFKNNILWNAGHNVVVQGMLCYGISGLELPFSSEFRDKFRKGTDAVAYSEDDLEEVKSLMEMIPDKLIDAYKSGEFVDYKPYETSYGITLKSIENAISFNNTHEGLHLGYMMALRKLV